MNKTELVEKIAASAGLNKTQAEAALNGFVTAVTEALVAGDKVALKGFGNFEVRERAARTGHNPQTGASIEIAASKAPAFKASSALKQAVNK